MALISKLNTLKSLIPRISIQRNFSNLNIGGKPSQNGNSQLRFKSMFPKFRANEESFKIKDQIPESFRLIYRNTMSNYLLSAQIVSVISAGVVCIYVFYYESTMKDYKPHMSTWKEQPVPVDNEIIVYCTAILAVSVILQYFIKKMPLRIYNFNDEKYVFVYYNVFPFYTKNYTCGVKEIRKLASKRNPILPWTDNRYEVHKNYGAIMIDHFFKNPAEQSIMLGLQKRYKEREDYDD